NVSKAALADLQSQSALLDSTIDRLAHALEKGQQQRSAMGADVHHYDLQATMLAQKRQEAQRQEQSLVSRNQALTTEQAQLTEQQMQAAAKVERLSELLETAQQHLACQRQEVEAAQQVRHELGQAARVAEQRYQEQRYQQSALHERRNEWRRSLQLAYEQKQQTERALVTVQGELFDMNEDRLQAAL